MARPAQPRRHGGTPPAHADDLPGPVRQPQSALARVRHRRRADPRLRSGQGQGRSREPGRRAPAPGAADAGRRPQVPARILRRPAPAHLDRPRAGEPSGVPGVRRAHLGARRLGAGADPEPDGRPAAPPAAHLSLHQPQPRGRLSHLHARGRDVPRPPGRGGADRHAVHASQASLHADASGHDPRPRHDRPATRAGGGRGAEPDQPADRLHLPSALPVRQRTLQGRASAGAAHRGRHGGVPRHRGRPARRRGTVVRGSAAWRTILDEAIPPAESRRWGGRPRSSGAEAVRLACSLRAR